MKEITIEQIEASVEKIVNKVLDEKLDAKLDVRFAAFEEKLDKKLDEKLNMELMRFYKLLHGEIEETHIRIDSMKADIGRLYELNDSVLKRLETQDQERAAANNQLNRHDSWIKHIAGQTNVQLATD